LLLRGGAASTQGEGEVAAFGLDEILARDKVSLDLTWLRDESLEDSASLPEPHVLAQEIADDLQAALAQMQGILVDLQGRVK
jgi:type I restriction enzyme M protein